MPTPDEMAAAAPTPLWRGEELPEKGRHVTIKHKITDSGRTRWVTVSGVVIAREAVADILAVALVDIDGESSPTIMLDAGSMLDKWAYTSNENAEHEYRKRFDPVYRHHSHMLDERMGMARLRTDRDQQAFEDAVPAVVVENIRKYGFPLADLTAAQRAAYDEFVEGEKPANPFGEEPATIPTAHGTSLAENHRRAVYLKAQMDALGAELEALKTEYNEVNAAMVTQFAEEGSSSLTVDGMTGYLNPKTYVSKVPGTRPEEILDALRASGLPQMVIETYSGGSLKSLLTDYQKNELPVPAAIAALCSLETDYEVRFVKAAAKKSTVVRKDTAPVVHTP